MQHLFAHQQLLILDPFAAMVLLKRSRAPVFKADRPFLFLLRQTSTGRFKSVLRFLEHINNRCTLALNCIQNAEVVSREKPPFTLHLLCCHLVGINKNGTKAAQT